MSYAKFTKFLLVVGFLSLLHAAYSAAQRKQTKHYIYSIERQKKKINDDFSIFRSNIFARHRPRKKQHIPSPRCEYATDQTPVYLNYLLKMNFALRCKKNT